MSDLAKRLRFIPTDLRVVVPVHFPAMFTQHERMPTLNTLDAGIVAHEAADRIDALEECLREIVDSNAAFLLSMVDNMALAMDGQPDKIDEAPAIASSSTSSLRESRVIASLRAS